MVRPNLTLALLIPVAVLAAGTPEAASAAVRAAVGPISVPGQITALSVGADGTLRAATITRTTVGDDATSSAAMSVIAPSGAISGGAPASGAGSTDTTVALTPDGGAIAAYAVPGTSRAAGAGSYVAIRTIGPDGAPGLEQDVSTPGQPARSPGQITIGPSGAVALTYLEDAPSTTGGASRTDPVVVPRLAFRPAGAANFSASVPLDAAGRTAAYVEYLNPAGGGMIVATPAEGTAKGATRLRRIAADGALGPWLTVGIGRRTDVTTSAAWSGSTFVLALRAVDQRRDEVLCTVYATTLSAAGKRPTRPQRLKAASSDGDATTLELVATTGGRVALAADGRNRRLQLFEGRPGKLRATDRILTAGLVTARLLPRPKGGLSVFWLGSAGKATDVRAFAAHRARGRHFGKRLAVRGYPKNPSAASFGSDAFSLAAPILLPGNKAAFAYNPERGSNQQPTATILTTR